MFGSKAKSTAIGHKLSEAQPSDINIQQRRRSAINLQWCRRCCWLFFFETADQTTKRVEV